MGYVKVATLGTESLSWSPFWPNRLHPTRTQNTLGSTLSLSRTTESHAINDSVRSESRLSSSRPGPQTRLLRCGFLDVASSVLFLKI